MVVQLTLVFLVPTHLGHLFQTVKHRLHDPIVCGIDSLSNLEGVRTDELVFDATDVCREVLDERCYTVSFLAGEFSVLDRLDMFILRTSLS